MGKKMIITRKDNKSKNYSLPISLSLKEVA
jgi:hypothetical protein